MRFIHLDEAGTSRQEKYAVVAGIISHADDQWRALNEYLSDMTDHLVPKHLRAGLVFHAKDLWHGSRKFNRDQWPRDLRVRIMREIAKIPVKFNIPVVTGIVEKKEYSWGKATPEEVDAWNYAPAFGTCAAAAGFFLRKVAGGNEVAMLILEDVPHMRRHAQTGYGFLKDESRAGQWKGAMAKCAPLTRLSNIRCSSPRINQAFSKSQILSPLCFADV